MSIGPSGIYNHAVNDRPMPAFCYSDSAEELQHYKTDFQSGGKGEFVEGNGMYCNILMLAARFANVGLIEHIVANADPKILNMRDNVGRTVLHHLVHQVTAHTTEKVMACARMLIQAGVEIDARHNMVPMPESTLNDDDFVGENALGYLIRELSNPFNSAEDRKKYKTLTQLFLMHGATQCYTMVAQHVCSFSLNDPVNEEDMGKRATCIRILRKLQVNNLDWPKTRLLFLGQKDAESPLSKLPIDLLKLIHQKKSLMSFTE